MDTDDDCLHIVNQKLILLTHFVNEGSWFCHIFSIHQLTRLNPIQMTSSASFAKTDQTWVFFLDKTRVAKVFTFAFVIFLNNPVKIGEVKENIKLRIKSEKSMLDINMSRPIPFHISRYLLCTIHFYPHWLIFLKSNFNLVKYHVVHTMTMYYIFNFAVFTCLQLSSHIFILFVIHICGHIFDSIQIFSPYNLSLDWSNGNTLYCLPQDQT